MIDTLVNQVQQKVNIVQACRVLRVSRASYYAARQRTREPAIYVASVKAAFRANQSCYGSRRVVDELKLRASYGALQSASLIVGFYNCVKNIQL